MKMKNVKRVLAAMLCIAMMAVMLVGCSGNKAKNYAENNT